MNLPRRLLVLLRRSSLRMLPILSCGMLALTFASCATGQRLGKARPAAQTASLQHDKDLRQDPPGAGPFHLVRRTTSPAVLKSAQRKPAIAVLPVDLRHLKPGGRTRVKIPSAQYAQTPVVQQMAALLRHEFQKESNHHAVPTRRNFLTLQLALTEFIPTNPGGNVVKTAAGFFVGPLTWLASPLTKGTLAIEGQVRDPATGRIVFQFADRESDPITWVSLRSYQSTAFAQIIIDQWAKQFARSMYSPAGTELKDAPVFRISPL